MQRFCRITACIPIYAGKELIMNENDVSFLLDAEMMLYEHQSTWNPNMPLRDLL